MILERAELSDLWLLFIVGEECSNTRKRFVPSAIIDHPNPFDSLNQHLSSFVHFEVSSAWQEQFRVQQRRGWPALSVAMTMNVEVESNLKGGVT